MLDNLFRHIVLVAFCQTFILTLIPLATKLIRYDSVFLYKLSRFVVCFALLMLPIAVIAIPMMTSLRDNRQIADQSNGAPIGKPDGRLVVESDFQPSVDHADSNQGINATSRHLSSTTVVKNIDVVSAFAIGYFVILLTVASIFLCRFIRTIQLLSHGKRIDLDKIPEDWIDPTIEGTKYESMYSRVTFVRSESLSSPASLWFFRPIVLLPADIDEQLTGQQIKGVLLHEVIHLMRRDWFWSVSEGLLTTIYWFHPFAWVATAYGRELREQSCDKLVVSILNKPKTYAETILKLYRSRADRMTALNSFRSAKSLTRRIHMLNARHKVLSTRDRTISIATLVFAMGFIVVGMTKLANACAMDGFKNLLSPGEYNQDREIPKLSKNDDMQDHKKTQPQNTGSSPIETAELQIVDLPSHFSLKFQADDTKRWKGEYVTDSEFDLNDDGVADLAVQSKFESAGLGQYFVVKRFVGLNGAKLLKLGIPQSNGCKISVVDLLKSTTEVPLCSVGGSVKHLDLPIEALSHGIWWNKNKMGLAIAIPVGGSIQAGYVVVSVSNNGQVDVGESKFSSGFDDEFIVEIE